MNELTYSHAKTAKQILLLSISPTTEIFTRVQTTHMYDYPTQHSHKGGKKELAKAAAVTKSRKVRWAHERSWSKTSGMRHWKRPRRADSSERPGSKERTSSGNDQRGTQLCGWSSTLFPTFRLLKPSDEYDHLSWRENKAVTLLTLAISNIKYEAVMGTKQSWMCY